MDRNNSMELRQRLEGLPTEELEGLLQAELQKEVPDGDLVVLLLHTLEGRDQSPPKPLNAREEKAWEEFKRKKRRGAFTFPVRSLARAASLLLVAGVLVSMLSVDATAGNFWKNLLRSTEKYFEYINMGAEETEPQEYVFSSENSGLQQVHDAVVDYLGVTDPVVVQWLPDEPELLEIKKNETDARKSVCAIFYHDGGEIVLAYEKMKMSLSPQYDIIEENVDYYEANGLKHFYTRNTDVWVVSWGWDELKCTICIDCNEETLLSVLKSIY